MLNEHYLDLLKNTEELNSEELKLLNQIMFLNGKIRIKENRSLVNEQLEDFKKCLKYKSKYVKVNAYLIRNCSKVNNIIETNNLKLNSLYKNKHLSLTKKYVK